MNYSMNNGRKAILTNRESDILYLGSQSSARRRLLDYAKIKYQIISHGSNSRGGGGGFLPPLGTEEKYRTLVVLLPGGVGRRCKIRWTQHPCGRTTYPLSVSTFSPLISFLGTYLTKKKLQPTKFKFSADHHLKIQLTLVFQD